MSHFDNPASMSLHEEATAAANRPMMGVFNNLVISTGLAAAVEPRTGSLAPGGNVFDLLLAEILEDKRQPAADVVMNPIGDEHPAEIGQGFDPRRDVDAVAINVIAVDEGNSSVDAPFQARENVGVAVARGRMLGGFN